MAIMINNIEYLSYEEQVIKNKRDLDEINKFKNYTQILTYSGEANYFIVPKIFKFIRVSPAGEVALPSFLVSHNILIDLEMVQYFYSIDGDNVVIQVKLEESINDSEYKLSILVTNDDYGIQYLDYLIEVL